LDPHPYDAAADEWWTTGIPTYRAMAANLRYDHRVADLREDEFDDIGVQPRNAASLQTAMTRYFYDHVRSQSNAAFVL
jgi:hypothetical protein